MPIVSAICPNCNGALQADNSMDAAIWPILQDTVHSRKSHKQL